MPRPATGSVTFCVLAGLLSITLACGGGGSSPKATLTFTSAPKATAIEAHLYHYELSASSSQGGSPRFSLVSGPTGAALNGNALEWTPNSTLAGTSQSIRIKAEDGGISAEQAWSISVSPNAAPTFSSTPPTNGKEMHSYTYTLSASDLNGDPIQFDANQLPPGATLNATQLTWIPVAGDVGQVATFSIAARDGFGGHVDQSWSVTPVANAQPVFTSQPPSDVVFVQGFPIFDYALTSTDADLDPVSFSLVQAPAGATLGNGIIHWQPTPDQERTPQTFVIRVSDGLGGSTDQRWTKAYSGVLRGTWADHHLTPDGKITTKPNLGTGSFTPQVLVPDGAGGFRQILGTFNSDGSICVAGIPPGHFWLNFGGEHFIWTDQGNLDTGRLILGRADTTASFDPAPVSLTLTGLDPWSYDSMRWIVPNHGSNLLCPDFTANPPAPNDTSLVAAVMPRCGNSPLVDATKSDELTLLQNGRRMQDSLNVFSIKKAFTTSTLIQIPGQTTAISGAFSTPPSATVNLDWDAAVPSSYLDQVHPGYTANSPILIGGSQQGEPSAGLQFLNQEDLTMVGWDYPYLFLAVAPSQGHYQQTLTFGDPYPGSWPRIFSSCITTTSNDGSNRPAGYFMTASNSPGTPDNPLKVQLSPARNPTVNGENFFFDQVGVGTSPVLSWDPPSLGSPTFFQILFIDAATGFSCTKDITVFGNSVQLPPGILEPGKSYWITIRSVSSGNPEIIKAPFRIALPLSTADCISGRITP